MVWHRRPDMPDFPGRSPHLRGGPALGPDRILVIDDDPDVLSTIVAVLQSDGLAATTTSDPTEAARLLETSTFDVVISDIVMPRLNGLDLLARARRANPDVQVVLVTAYATRDVALDALQRGAAGLLEKPFTTEKLRAVAREALRRAHAARQRT